MMFTRIFFFILFLSFISQLVFAQFQCISGNCVNGYGVSKYSLNGNYLGTYEGYFKDSKFDGKGKFLYKEGDVYEGEWSEGLPNGQGIRFYSNGNAEGGIWVNGKLTEKDSKIQAANKCISGDCMNGYGASRDAKGRNYTGNFKKGAYHGFGIIKYPNGDRYEGYWSNGLYEGQGSMYFSNGHVDTGEWEKGRFKGQKTRVWALIVGVSDYSEFPKLNYTLDDARSVYSFFMSPEGGALPKNQILLLENENATALNIQNSMADLFEQADTSDLIIFYFAGHGKPGSFLPYDFKEDGSNQLYHGMVTTLMMDSPAKYKLIIADACHSGSFSVSYNDYTRNNYQMPEAETRGGDNYRERIKNYYKGFNNVRGGLAIIMSSASEEISLEATKLKHGVFSHFIITGLKGFADADDNGMITVNELYEFLSKNVRKYTYGFQTPMVFGDYDSNMNVGSVHKP